MAHRSSQRTRRSQRPRHAGVVDEAGFLECSNPTAWVRALRCNSVYITRHRSMRIPVSIRTSYFMADKRALVDSGATDNFINLAFAKRMGLGLQQPPHPR